MPDDTHDGALGGEARPVERGSMADLTARANAAGFPTLSDYVDHLEARALAESQAERDAADDQMWRWFNNVTVIGEPQMWACELCGAHVAEDDVRAHYATH